MDKKTRQFELEELAELLELVVRSPDSDCKRRLAAKLSQLLADASK